MRQPLAIIQTGQKAHLAAIGTHTHNINNANTQGHQRQQTDLVPLIVGGVGLGTKALPPHRVVDQSLTEKVFAHTSHVEYARTLSKAASDFVIQFGVPGEGRDNLHSCLEGFARSLEVLHTQASDSKPLRESLNAAKGLASTINQMSETIREQRENADLQIKTAIERLNGQFDDLIQLNRLINYGVSRDNASAESERDRIIGEITKDLDVRVKFLDTNAVELFIEGGAQRLLYPKAAFSFERTQPFDATKLHSSGRLSGVVVNGQDLTERIIASKKGKLAGLLHIRDEMMPKFQEQLDEFAAKLRDQTNALHNEGTSFPPRNKLEGLRHIPSAEIATLEGSGIVRFVLMREAQGAESKPQYMKEKVVELNLGECKQDGTVLGTSFTAAPTLRQLVNVLNGSGGFGQNIFSIQDNCLHLTAPIGHRLGIVSDQESPGVLSLTSTGETQTPCLGFSHLFGLNDFFVARHSNGRSNVTGDGTLAISDSFSVHPSIERQPEYQSRGRLRQKDGGFEGTETIFDGTSDASKDLATSIRKGSLLFQRAGYYPQSTTTLFDYAAGFISSIAQKANEAQKALQQREIQLHSYEDASERLSSVDLMSELQELTRLHNNYLADLRVAEVIHSLVRAVLDIIRSS